MDHLLERSQGSRFRSQLEKDGRLFSDRIQIKLISDDEIDMTSREYYECDEDPETCPYHDFTFTSNKKWAFMSRITACRHLQLSLYNREERADDQPEPIRKDIKECFEFYKLLPNLRHTDEFKIYVLESKQFECTAKHFPITFHRDINILSKRPSMIESEQQELVKIIGNCSETVENLHRRVKAPIILEEIGVMWKFNGEIEIKFKQEDHFLRSLKAIVSHGFDGACFETFMIRMKTDNPAAFRFLDSLDEIMRSDRDFRRVINYQEAIRGFDLDDLNVTPAHFVTRSGYFENRNPFKQFFYRKRVSDTVELAVILSVNNVFRNHSNILFCCKYRDIDGNEMETSFD